MHSLFRIGTRAIASGAEKERGRSSSLALSPSILSENFLSPSRHQHGRLCVDAVCFLDICARLCLGCACYSVSARRSTASESCCQWRIIHGEELRACTSHFGRHVQVRPSFSSSHIRQLKLNPYSLSIRFERIDVRTEWHAKLSSTPSYPKSGIPKWI